MLTHSARSIRYSGTHSFTQLHVDISSRPLLSLLLSPFSLFSLLSSLFSLLSSLSSLLHALLLIFKNKVHGGVSGLLAHVYPGIRLPKKIIKLQDSMIHQHFLLNYSDHEWHSKKFRSNIARWDKVSQEKYMAYPFILLMFVSFLFCFIIYYSISLYVSFKLLFIDKLIELLDPL